ncbi:MAG: cyclic nucleotide-binding domain-containing protein [Acidimicrobiia bacterium]
MTPTRSARSVRDLADELTRRQLRSVALFSECSPAELSQIAACSVERRAAVGEEIVRAGALADPVTIVLDGYAGAEIHQHTAIVLGPGAVIGGPEALDGALQPMTVTAHTPMVVRIMTAKDFSEIVATVPSLAMALIRQLGGRTRTVLDELACARQGSVTPWTGSTSSPVQSSSSSSGVDDSARG